MDKVLINFPYKNCIHFVAGGLAQVYTLPRYNHIIRFLGYSLASLQDDLHWPLPPTMMSIAVRFMARTPMDMTIVVKSIKKQHGEPHDKQIEKAGQAAMLFERRCVKADVAYCGPRTVASRLKAREKKDGS